MQLEEAMYRRRSVREFLDNEVPENLIEKLLAYAMSGPSACNTRPWEFYVIKSPEKRKMLRKTTRYTDYASSVIIIIAGNTKHMLPRQFGDFWIQDCSAAVENILLGAVSIGLGSCWCGLYPKKEAVQSVRDALGLSENIIPLGLIHIGYPAVTPEPRTQYDEERVHYI
ncbi:MAG: nitroreductase family protein [Eubacteriales bacterium]|nr:nitroreductase family protein [Eubacteriales bacterium]